MKKILFLAILFLAIASGNAQWLTNGNNTYYNNGNVGIGTTEPIQSLHIFRPGISNFIKIDKTSHSFEAGIEFANNGTNEFFIYTDNDGTNDLKIQASGLSGENDANPRIIIPKNNKNIILGSSGGNIGIGTSSPATQMHMSRSFNGELSLLIQNTYGTGARTYLTSLPNKSLIQTDSDFSISNNYGGWSDKFILKHNGSVGIGTTTPQATLDVNGSIRSKEVKVTALNATDVNVEGNVETMTLKINGDVPKSDYVFEKDYALRSLEDVESFVTKNKHLPEVPSAAEFEENGYSVGQMDDILLRKVEELTLYVIEMDKKVATLKQENTELKKEIKDIKNNL